MKNNVSSFLGAAAVFAAASLCSPANAIHTMNGLSAAFAKNLNNVDTDPYKFTNINTSAAYTGRLFPACPVVHSYDIWLVSSTVAAVKINSDAEILAQCRSLLNKALEGIKDSDISLFFVAQIMEQTVVDASANVFTTSFKPQHWLVKENSDSTFDRGKSYNFDCSVGLFNTNIFGNGVTSSGNQIAIDSIQPVIGKLSVHPGTYNLPTLSGDVLNFQIKNKCQHCAFFSVVRDVVATQTSRIGAAVTLHILVNKGTPLHTLFSTAEKEVVVDELIKLLNS